MVIINEISQSQSASPRQAGPQVSGPEAGQRAGSLHLLDGGHVVHQPHVGLAFQSKSFSTEVENIIIFMTMEFSPTHYKGCLQFLKRTEN